MIEHKEQFTKYAKGEDFDPQRLNSAVKHLIDIVVRKDFQEYPDEQELRSIMKIELFEQLEGDEFDTDRDPVPFLHKCLWQRASNHIRQFNRQKEKHDIPLYVDDWSKVEEAHNTEERDTNFRIKYHHDYVLEMLPEETDEVKPLTNHLMGIKLYEYFFNEQVRP